MIVDQLRAEPRGDGIETSARLRWIGGEFRLRIEVPAVFAPPEDDASAFLGPALMMAMYRHEDLHVEGAVSPLLMRESTRAQRAWAAWDPQIRLCRVSAALEAPARPRPPGVGCFFSRGVDSLFSATLERDEPLTHLVFCDTLEPVQGEAVRAEERRLAAEVAALLGLELAVVSPNIRDPDAQLLDYTDMYGMGLAFMGLSLAGGLGEIVIPPGMDISTLVPAGNNPMVDVLFSTESTRIGCDDISYSRVEKLRGIGARRPELLPYLKVCFMEDRSDNCGRCRKCIWTMVCLRAAGLLDLATGFPRTIDLEAIRRIRLSDLLQRLLWAQTADCLQPEADELREAIEAMLRHSARPPLRERVRIAADYAAGRRERLDPAWSDSPSAFLRNFTNATLSLARGHRPMRYGPGLAPAAPGAPSSSFGPPDATWAGPPPEPPPGLVGLVRMIDRSAGRHRYGAGSVPPVAGAERVGELGALLREPAGGAVPVWLTEDGRLQVDGHSPPASRRISVRSARWVAAPARWRGVAPPARRARELLRRALFLATSARGALAGQEGERPVEPVGYLRPPGDGSAGPTLWHAVHPVTGDQLLSTDPLEAADLGYVSCEPIGTLEPAAPVTGQLGTGMPFIPWAARFGQRRM